MALPNTGLPTDTEYDMILVRLNGKGIGVRRLVEAQIRG